MYSIVFTVSAQKELLKLKKADILKILQKIESLAENPKPTNSIKIKGKLSLWRIRSGNYRIIYSLIEDELIIEVIRIRHRKDVYRNL